MSSVFLKLYNTAKKRFKKEYLTFGYSEKDFKALENSMGPGSSPGNMMIFQELTMNLLKNRKVRHFEELDALVRAFQALDNHFPFSYEGQNLSGFLMGAMRTNYENACKVPKNWKAYMELAYKAHEAIDECFQGSQKRRFKEKKELTHKSPVIFKDQKDIDDFLRDDTHAQSLPTCHHILDWYLQLDAAGAYKKSPEKLAAFAIKITMEINWHATGRHPFYIDNSYLAAFSGYSSGGSFSSSVTTHIYTILYGVGDLGLLLVDGVNAPEDWRERLRKFAPALPGKVEDFIEGM